jgi:hypothetical protein
MDGESENQGGYHNKIEPVRKTFMPELKHVLVEFFADQYGCVIQGMNDYV